jgi:hypothetical protein
MVALLRDLRCSLSNTVVAWDKFQKKELGYFLFDDHSSDRFGFASSLRASIGVVDDSFSEMRDVLRKLQVLEKELCEDNPQGVSHPCCSNPKNCKVFLLFEVLKQLT